MREVAEEERRNLGLEANEPLDPYALAGEHGIPVYSLTELLDFDLVPEACDHFHSSKAKSWSAALVPIGSARIIVENDAHASVRRRSNIAHELGHHLLEHPFESVVLGEDHKRQFDRAMEKQALFVSAHLLISEEAARRAAYDGWDNAQVAQFFEVSEQFAQMRMSGPRVIARRAAQRFGRKRS